MSGESQQSARRGHRAEASSPDGLLEAVEAARDYRGDVTLELTDGASLTGYLYDWTRGSADPVVRMLPADGSPRRTVRLAQVKAVSFTGDDKAAGKSWQAWVARYEERKRLIAAGLPAGDIEPEPEALG